jgi:ADP-ribosylglycohydrolase
MSISKFRGAILGTAIGDALGAPTESMTKDEIEAANIQFNGDFIDHFRPRQDVIMKRGSWTDDTQLMIPLLKSIIIEGCINPFDVALRLQDIYESGETLRGWSRSTKLVAKRLSQGVPWHRAADASLGMGNGAAMRAAPLGLYLSYMVNKFGNDQKTDSDMKHCINSIIAVGKITHHEIGITAGLLQSVLIAGLVSGSSKTKLMTALKSAESNFLGSYRFTNKLKSALKFNDVKDIAANSGVDSRADRSWITTAAVFLKTRRKADAMPTMFELIKQGGDTDTNAAMYGALAGAKWGVSVFPKHLRKNVEDSSTLISLSDSLFDALYPPE